MSSHCLRAWSYRNLPPGEGRPKYRRRSRAVHIRTQNRPRTSLRRRRSMFVLLEKIPASVPHPYICIYIYIYRRFAIPRPDCACLAASPPRITLQNQVCHILTGSAGAVMVGETSVPRVYNSSYPKMRGIFSPSRFLLSSLLLR